MTKNSKLPVATISLYGVVLDPISVSIVLKCEPSYSQIKGQSFTSPSGKQRIAKTGLWLLDSDRFCSSLDVSDHVECLLQAVKPDLDLRTVPGVDIAVLNLAILSGEQPELVELTPQLLGRLTKLGLTLKIEAY